MKINCLLVQVYFEQGLFAYFMSLNFRDREEEIFRIVVADV